MAEIINLRRARKAKVRAERAADAQSNRASHGRGKGERRAAQAQTDKAERFVEAHRLVKSPGPDEPR